MKKFLVLIVMVFIFFNTVQTKANTKGNSLENILSHSNSTIVRKEIFGYGHFKSSIDNKTTLNRFLVKNFSKYKFKISETNNSIIGEYTCNNFSYTVTIANTQTSKQDKFISIFYSHNLAKENIINLRETILNMIIPLDSNAKVSSHIVSKIDGMLTKNEISSTISFMLKSSRASFHKDYDDSSVSFSGFSPLLSEIINVNGENINIQASGKYSNIDNSTYIWVGSPIISTEY
ncbi:MAG: YwmB family TATA-box binding protein [Clostridium sp.]